MQRVVVGALIRGGRVLLVHRRPNKRANPDVWDLPGGLIEQGESELEALERELRGELGLQIWARCEGPEMNPPQWLEPIDPVRHKGLYSNLCSKPPLTRRRSPRTGRVCAR